MLSIDESDEDDRNEMINLVRRKVDAVNFCRSHREAEVVYNRYFARAVKLNPKVLKAVSSWYPRHLVWARSILGREPKWSPDFKAK